MRLINFEALCSSTQRSNKSCSAPHSSGNSANNTLPPRATSKSEVYPTAGLAEIPLNPSLPPHLTPIVNALKGAGCLSSLFISIRPLKVCRIASAISCSSLCDCCCSNISSGLLKDGFLSFISFRK